MSIVNIIDRRKDQYIFKKITAVLEATWHDNTVTKADKVERVRGDDEPDTWCEEQELSLEEAIIWGTMYNVPVTLYLYDRGANQPVDDEQK